ncbi:MAG TPA: DJ-1/PfpI family protein [Kiritimatiellia bacterium]|jgi:4-methyl-5(b-hydroxyethyl)-thiazole monophosphate biosynthesis|nr:DJ-1/PfpI family protein [Kiritimatiellia bacterium]
MRVLVPLADGVEEIEAVTVIDVLRRGGIEVVSAALGHDRSVAGSRDVVLLADTVWDELEIDSFGAIVLPGGGLGTENLAADQRVLATLRAFAESDKFVAAICAAPTVLAQAGVLKGRRATCYPACAEALGKAYDEAPVIADGHIITSQGPGTAMLFALVLVRHFADEETARKVADGLLVAF